MLEKYKNKFPNFCNNISLAIKEKRISHAYLIDVSNISNYIDIIKAMAIDILKINNSEIEYEKLIENESYSDFFILSPIDSRWIKKEQILSLQEKYKTKSIYNNKKIYIIDKADDLNLSSSNTLLKFLEEPTDDVVAILITRNKYNVLPTISSRCQFIKLDVFLEESDKDLKVKVIEFLKLLRKAKENIFPYIKSFNIDLENKEILSLFVEEIIKCYSDLCRIILKKEVLYYSDYENELLELSKNQSISEISKKILDIEGIYRNIEFNVNSRLFIDKLVIIMVGVDINV